MSPGASFEGPKPRAVPSLLSAYVRSLSPAVPPPALKPSLLRHHGLLTLEP